MNTVMNTKTFKIYRINFPNNNFYIGATSNRLQTRLIAHSHCTTKVGMAIKEVGIDNVTISLLYEFETEEDMFQKEAELINKDLINDPHCLNMRTGGKFGAWGDTSTKGKPGKHKGPITYQGVEYKSINDCAKKTGISPHSVRKYIANGLEVKTRSEAMKEHRKNNSWSGGSNKGSDNGGFKGTYHTPTGVFESSREAARENGVSQKTVLNRCKYTDEKFKEWYFTPKSE